MDFKIPELTHKNHFEFGYNQKPFTLRKTPEDKWFVKYGRCERQPLNFHDECLATAKLIRNKTDQPLHVMFSGGVDSEVVLRSFYENEIKIQVAILRYKNDLNIHDVSWAIVICDYLKIPYKIYDLDLIEFWNSPAADQLAQQTYCPSPQLLPAMWLIDQIPGYPIMGSGECLFVKNRPDDYVPGVSPYLRSDWMLYEKEKVAAWYRHFIIKNRTGCPGFFQYTPEIMLSYLQDPFVDDLIHDRIVGKLSTESSKLKIYQQHFKLYDRSKYTGFEKVTAEDAKYRAVLLQRYGNASEISKISTDDLKEMLKPV